MECDLLRVTRVCFWSMRINPEADPYDRNSLSGDLSMRHPANMSHQQTDVNSKEIHDHGTPYTRYYWELIRSICTFYWGEHARNCQDAKDEI